MEEKNLPMTSAKMILIDRYQRDAAFSYALKIPLTSVWEAF